MARNGVNRVDNYLQEELFDPTLLAMPQLRPQLRPHQGERQQQSEYPRQKEQKKVPERRTTMQLTP